MKQETRFGRRSSRSEALRQENGANGCRTHTADAFTGAVERPNRTVERSSGVVGRSNHTVKRPSRAVG